MGQDLFIIYWILSYLTISVVYTTHVNKCYEQLFLCFTFFSYEGSLQFTENIYCCRLQAGTNIADVQSSIRNKEVSAFLSYGGGSLEKFWEEINRQDQLKGTDIKDYLSELAATRI